MTQSLDDQRKELNRIAMAAFERQLIWGGFAAMDEMLRCKLSSEAQARFEKKLGATTLEAKNALA
jgi:hypothetical protein